MSFQEKLLDLANRLLKRTADGNIKWSETADEDSFRALLTSGTVRVERSLTNGSTAHTGPITSAHELATEDRHAYVLVVLDERSREIGRFVPEDEARLLTIRNLWE